MLGETSRSDFIPTVGARPPNCWAICKLSTDVIGKARTAVRRPTHIPQDQSGTETLPVLGQIIFDVLEFAYSTGPSVNVLNQFGISWSPEPGKTVAFVDHMIN
ncbi:hypothetical protein B9Z55_028491 [Caenorhabditis nigoni]|uniref:Uncharacterized protein n=1 Tax=Caenorhabditis nigoni TaxID=1611254 RepID=A0A2G5SBB4_9PELO|nr:hypothetical protein B9Z55_028491 [Caenorhabditis nigoni]